MTTPHPTRTKGTLSDGYTKTGREMDPSSAYYLGRKAEEAVARLYVAQGYTLLQRNFHSHQGEIDLICAKGDTLHFIEVKARSNVRYAAPQEAVCSRKRHRLRRTALYFLFCHPYLPYVYYLFDIAEVYLNRGKIHLLCNAFTLEGESWTE